MAIWDEVGLEVPSEAIDELGKFSTNSLAVQPMLYVVRAMLVVLFWLVKRELARGSA